MMLKSLCHYILNLSPGTHGIWLSDGVSQIWHAISTVFANSNLARYYHSFSQNQIWHAISTVFSANSNLARYFHFFLQIQIWNSISTVFRKFMLRFACYIHGFPANLRAKMQSPPLQAIFVVGKHPKCAD